MAIKNKFNVEAQQSSKDIYIKNTLFYFIKLILF